MSAIPAMHSQSQHHLRAHCSYKSHIPQTKSLCSWLWVSKIALNRQQGWGLFAARSTRGETHKVNKQGDAVRIRTAFLPSHLFCLSPANNHPPHTRLPELFKHKLPLQFKYRRNCFSSSAGKMQKSLSWENQSENQPLPLLRNYRHLSRRWHTQLQAPEAATPWDPSASLGNACQNTSLVVGKLYAVHCLAHGLHVTAVTSKSPSSEEGCPGNFCLLSRPSPHSS